MIKILEHKFEKQVSGKNYIRADIVCDTVDELVTEYENNVFTQGSITLVINTGDFYVLNSSGTWQEQ